MRNTFFDKPEKVTLLYGDSLSLLDELRYNNRFFNLIFADPPYFLSNGGMSVHAGKRVKVDKGGWDKSNGFDTDYEFTYVWIKKCKKLLTDNGTIWISGTLHNIYLVGFILQKLGFTILNDIEWFKPNAPPHLACRYFAHAHETLLWAKKSKKAKHTFHYQQMKQWNDNKDFIKNDNKQMRSVWAISLTPQKEKKFGKHPTQKPEALLKRVILSSSNAGDTVLDPFCGSGTTGAVAVEYGRNFVGIDNNSDFLSIAKKRIEAKIDNANNVSQPTTKAADEIKHYDLINDLHHVKKPF